MKEDFGSLKLASETDTWFKAKEPGDYQIRIVSDYHKVDKWWAGKDGEWAGQKIESGRPYLYSPEDKEGVPMDLVKIDKLKGRDGEDYDRISVNNGYAWLVINRKDNRIQVWEVFQKGILKDLQKFSRIKKNLTGYDITLTREGTGMQTRWSVTALDTKALSKEDKVLVEENEIELEEVFKRDAFNDKAKIDRLKPQVKNDKDDIPF